jgi:hypothetical protein
VVTAVVTAVVTVLVVTVATLVVTVGQWHTHTHTAITVIIKKINTSTRTVQQRIMLIDKQSLTSRTFTAQSSTHQHPYQQQHFLRVVEEFNWCIFQGFQIYCFARKTCFRNFPLYFTQGRCAVNDYREMDLSLLKPSLIRLRTTTGGVCVWEGGGLPFVNSERTSLKIILHDRHRLPVLTEHKSSASLIKVPDWSIDAPTTRGYNPLSPSAVTTHCHHCTTEWETNTE